MKNWRLTHLQELLADDPDNEFLLYAIAQEKSKLGLIEEAIDGYEKLRKINPDYIGLYYHLAYAYAEIEQYDKAFQTFDEGITRAKKAGDHHALAELKNARLNLEMEL